MPPESNPRDRRGYRPGPNGGHQNVNGHDLVPADPTVDKHGDTWMVEIGDGINDAVFGERED